MKASIEQVAGIDGVREVLTKARACASKAHERAAKRAVQGMKTDGVRGVGKTYTVKRKHATQSIKFLRGGAGIYSSGKRINVLYFQHRKNTSPGRKGGKAVFSKLKRYDSGIFLNEDAIGGSRVSKAFMATLPSRGRGVYRRIVGKKTKGNQRLTHARGESVPEMLGHPDVRRSIESGAQDRYGKEFDRQLNRELDAALKGGVSL